MLRLSVRRFERRVIVLDGGIMAIAQSEPAFITASLFRCVATEQFLFSWNT
jgi:hypothetical protein